MKKAALFVALILAVSGISARAEQQVYSPYAQPVMQQAPGYTQNQTRSEAIYEQLHHNRVYPGREGYGTQFGNIPQHPGDYRDAVDRGQWVSGTSTAPHSFRVE